jgi:transposase
MDTEREGVMKPSRRLRTLAQKREMVEETLQPGASVAVVARRHEVNANLLFTWRRQYRQGLLEPVAAMGTPRLLPVKVSTPPPVASRQVSSDGWLAIDLANGHRLTVYAAVDVPALMPVLKLLLQRC